MSHYNDFETTITDQEALVRALCRCTAGLSDHIWTRDEIESLDKPKNLYGYHGDQREQVAHVIVRRAYIGQASNDLGFVKNKDGNFVALVSDYDRDSVGFTSLWLTKLYTYYNVEKSKMEFEARGIQCTETLDAKGRIQLRAKFKTDMNKSSIKVRR